MVTQISYIMIVGKLLMKHIFVDKVITNILCTKIFSFAILYNCKLLMKNVHYLQNIDIDNNHISYNVILSRCEIFNVLLIFFYYTIFNKFTMI